MSATKELKRQSEFLQLHDSHHNCRTIQRAIAKCLKVSKFRIKPVAPVALPLFAGVPLKDWMLAAKARREAQDRKSRHEKQLEKLEAAKKQAAAAQAKKYNNTQWN